MIGDPLAFEAAKTEKTPLLSGLWQWSKAFKKFGAKGSVRLVREAEDIDTDIIHVNMTGGNLALPQMLRDSLGNSSSVKIVVNVDFDVSSWGANWIYPTLLEKALNCADLIFHVEPVGAKTLEFALKRKVYELPHPVDIVGLDEYKKEVREPYVTNVFHRYYPDITVPYWALRDLPLKSVLIGYGKGTVAPLPMYDVYYSVLPFIEAIDVMSRGKFGLDLFHGYSYGRVVAEFAALATPCVCSETIAAAHRCFPDLVVNPYDVKRANELFWKMIEDDEFANEVCLKKGYYAVKHYSLECCYKRMVEALEEIEDKEAK